MTLKILAPAFATIFLAGCGSAASKIPAAFFTCADGTHFSASFPDGKARVNLPGQKTAVLPQVRSASGYWYASNRYQLRGKGKTATWTADQHAPVQCKAQP